MLRIWVILPGGWGIKTILVSLPCKNALLTSSWFKDQPYISCQNCPNGGRLYNGTKSFFAVQPRPLIISHGRKPCFETVYCLIWFPLHSKHPFTAYWFTISWLWHQVPCVMFDKCCKFLWHGNSPLRLMENNFPNLETTLWKPRRMKC
jgi:hypothetical protein